MQQSLQGTYPVTRRYGWRPVELLLSSFALIVGSFLLSKANDTYLAFIGVMVFILLLFMVDMLLKGDTIEQRAMLLSYSSCILVAGLSQWYSLEEFKVIVSTLDSIKFYDLIHNPQVTTIEELSKFVNSPLAVFIWQKFYHLIDAIGGEGRAWLAVCINSAIIGLSSALTVKCSRIIFPYNSSSWIAVGTLAPLCGLNLLFGSLILRDCFALFFNIVIFYWLLRVYTYKGMQDWVLAAIFIVLATFAMTGIRESSLILCAVVVCLAVFSWVVSTRISPAKIILILLMFAAILALYRYVASGVSTALLAFSDGSDQYTRGAAYAARKSSLGVNLIVNQPFYIKIFVAPIYVYLFPIPAWGFFQLGLTPYYIIRGIQAIFAIVFLPQLAMAIVQMTKRFVKQRRAVKPTELFLILYFLTMSVMVAMTTMESRHYGQFIFALILIIASVSPRGIKNKRSLRFYRTLCYSGCVLLHAVWVVLRYL